MWFLQADKLLVVAIFSFAAGVIQTHFKKAQIKYIMPVAEIAVLSLFGISIAVFYTLYIALGLFFCTVLKSVRKKTVRRILFFVFSLISITPLIFARGVPGYSGTGIGLFTVGIAFNMLKAIDALYHSYYAEEKIPTLTYVNYMLFLPVFTAGPVFRYRDFTKAFNYTAPLTEVSVTKAVKRIIRGLFKKVVLLSVLTQVFDYTRSIELHFYVSLPIIFLSYIILYLDMSGYADIAIGFGGLCGMEVPENFKKPWLAPTMTQFWRSWHATVSDWMREHIFVILAPKRLNNVQSAFVALITMVTLSMWHGFSVLYFLGGIYNGLFLFFENITARTSVNRRKVSKGYFYLRCFLTNLAFAVNTLFFTVPADELFKILKGVVR